MHNNRNESEKHNIKLKKNHKLKVVRAITPTLSMRVSQISYESTVFKIYQGAEDAKKYKCVKPIQNEKKAKSSFHPYQNGRENRNLP